MPDPQRISELDPITADELADDDVFVVVDTSDTTMAPSGTDKKIRADELRVPATGWYSSASLDGDVIAVEFTTPFGIDATTGVPYFDPGNVTAGEEAVLLEDLTLMQPGK